LACCVGRARLAPLEAPSALRQAEPRVNIAMFAFSRTSYKTDARC
jgi:hypothetical protein